MFAVWPYVIAHMRPNGDRTVFTVELNPDLIARVIGEKEADVEEVIRKCCEPDPRTRTHTKEGRKLVQIDSYLYEVVNGATYDRIKRTEDLKEQNRIRQARHYRKKKGKSPKQVRLENESRSRRADEAEGRGDRNGAEAIAAEGLPGGGN